MRNVTGWQLYSAVSAAVLLQPVYRSASIGLGILNTSAEDATVVLHVGLVSNIHVSIDQCFLSKMQSVVNIKLCRRW